MKVTQFHFVKKALTLVWETGKSWIIVSFLVRIVLGLIPIVSVLLIQNIINEITLYFDNESKGLRSVIWLLLLQFGMLFFQSAVINLMKIFDLKIEQKLDYKLEKQISNKAAWVIQVRG
jgi:ATP-binding cassette, subfamily B, bacterial